MGGFRGGEVHGGRTKKEGSEDATHDFVLKALHQKKCSPPCSSFPSNSHPVLLRVFRPVTRTDRRPFRNGIANCAIQSILITNPSVDRVYLADWAKKLGVEERLSQSFADAEAFWRDPGP